jgi:hypothetical protein
MNGIQSLMQGAPTQRLQQPQLQQPLQAPATLDQNDPRMAAAMNVVENDVPEPLKEFVDKNDFAQKAIALLQSAGGQAAMDQTPAKPPTIKQRVDQQAMEGVAGLLQRLAPGMQQRGRQVQSQQARQMLGGGMPTMGAPNMARMAMGGIVGYAGPDGSKVEAMAPQTPVTGQTQNPSPGYLDPEVAAFLRRLEELNKQLDAAFPQEKDLFEQKITDLLNTTSPRVKRIASDSQFGLPKKDGMAMGGIVGYAGPTGSLVGGMSADEDFTNSNIYMPNELAGSEDEDILRRARQQMNRDPEAEAIAAGERLRGLIGADELMAQRAKKQAALDAQREAMFSPEESRRRRISAGLAGLAERGLGGFGAGDTAERDKISAERLASSEASVANMDKLIGELRELGMSQFEAEKQAREMVQKATEQGASTSQAIVDSRRRAQDAAANRATQERGQDMVDATQRYVADRNAGRRTDQVRGVEALMAEAKAKGTPITEAEALRQYTGMQANYLGVTQRGAQANVATREKAIELAREERNAFIGDMAERYASAKDPEVLFQERIAYYMQQLGGTTPPASTTTGVDISSINPVAVQNLQANPTAENRAFFDQAFGVGSAAAVLGQ